MLDPLQLVFQSVSKTVTNRRDHGVMVQSFGTTERHWELTNTIRPESPNCTVAGVESSLLYRSIDSADQQVDSEPGPGMSHLPSGSPGLPRLQCVGGNRRGPVARKGPQEHVALATRETSHSRCGSFYPEPHLLGT